MQARIDPGTTRCQCANEKPRPEATQDGAFGVVSCENQPEEYGDHATNAGHRSSSSVEQRRVVADAALGDGDVIGFALDADEVEALTECRDAG